MLSAKWHLFPLNELKKFIQQQAEWVKRIFIWNKSDVFQLTGWYDESRMYPPNYVHRFVFVIILSVLGGFMIHLSIDLKVTSLILGQSYDRSSASKANLKNMVNKWP